MRNGCLEIFGGCVMAGSVIVMVNRIEEEVKVELMKVLIVHFKGKHYRGAIIRETLTSTEKERRYDLNFINRSHNRGYPEPCYATL